MPLSLLFGLVLIGLELLEQLQTLLNPPKNT